MKKRVLSLALTLCMVLSLLPSLAINGAADLTFSGGTGTAADPYLISTVAQLQSLNSDTTYLSKSYRLMNDIVLNSDFTTLGCTGEAAQAVPFTGTFDGAGYGIYSSNSFYRMYAKAAGTSGTSGLYLYVGLFAVLDGATVKNLKVQGVPAILANARPSSTGGTSYVGGIAGRGINGSTIDNCRVENAALKGYYFCYVGGIVGNLKASTVINCDVAGGSLTADPSGANSQYSYVGGIAGGGEDAMSIVNCTAIGTSLTSGVPGNATSDKSEMFNRYMGGLLGCWIGNMEGNVPTLTNDYASVTGLSSGDNYCGSAVGALGPSDAAPALTLTNVYASGSVPLYSYCVNYWGSTGTHTVNTPGCSLNTATLAASAFNTNVTSGGLKRYTKTDGSVSTERTFLHVKDKYRTTEGDKYDIAYASSETAVTYTIPAISATQFVPEWFLWESEVTGNWDLTSKHYTGDSFTLDVDQGKRLYELYPSQTIQTRLAVDTTQTRTVSLGSGVGYTPAFTQNGTAVSSSYPYLSTSEYTVSYKVNGVYQAAIPAAMGTYDVKVDIPTASQYKFMAATYSIPGGLTVSKTALTDDNVSTYMFLSPGSADYDGTAKSATIVVRDGAPTLTGLTVSYKLGTADVASPTDPGAYDVYVTAGTGANYTTTAPVKVGTFNIYKATPTLTIAAAPTSQTYPGNIVLTATITVPSGAAAPTGPVSFYKDFDYGALGTTDTITRVNATTYTATFTWTAPDFGTHKLWVQSSSSDAHYYAAKSGDGSCSVAKATPVLADFTLSPDADITTTYGTDFTAPTVTSDNATLFGFIQYQQGTAAADFTKPTAVGTYKILIFAQGSNYNTTTFDTGKTLTINKADPAVADFTMHAYAANPVYDGSGHGYSFAASGTAAGTITTDKTGMGAVTVMYAAKTGSTYGTPSATQPINAGTYGVYVSAAAGDNYSATTAPILLGDMTIDKATLTADNWDTFFSFYTPDNPNYTGTAKAAGLPARNGFTGLGAPTLYYSATDAKGGTSAPTNAGTCYVYASFTAGDNFNAVAEANAFKVGQFTINTVAPTVTVTAVKKNGTDVPTGALNIYNPLTGGQNAIPYRTLTYGDTVTFEVTVEGVNNEKPTGTVEIQRYNNPADTISAQGVDVVDGKATLTVTVGDPLHATASVSTEDDFKKIYASFTPDAGAANYTWNTSDWKNYYVAPRPVTFTVSGTEQTYDGSEKTIALTPSATALTQAANFKVSYYKVDENEGVLASTTPVTRTVATGKYLYVIDFNSTAHDDYTIARKFAVSSTALPTLTDYDNAGYMTIKAGSTAQQKPISFAKGAVTAAVTDGTYKNTLNNTNNSTITYESSDAAVAAVAADGTVTLVGEGQATITATSDMEGTTPVYASYTLTVVKTAKTISFRARTVTYGDAAGYTAEDLVLPDGVTPADLTGTLTVKTSYKPGSAAGDYDAAPAGLTSSKYALTFEPGTLTVAPKELTADDLVFTADSKTYDGTTAASASVTVASGTYGTDRLTVDFTAAFAGKDSGPDIAVNFTGLSLSGSKADNYTLTPTTGTAYAAINPATVRILCAANTTKLYTGEAQGVDASAMCGGLAFTAYTLTYDGAATAPTDIGTYTVGAVPDDETNYTVEPFTASLTIAEARQDDFTLGGIPGSVYYGDTFTVTADGAQGDVTYAVTGPAEVDDTGTVTITGTGAVTLTATSVRDNYTDKVIARSFAANPRILTVAEVAAQTDRVYNGETGVDVTVTLGNVVNGDPVAAAATGSVITPDAGNGKLVYVSDIRLTGNDDGYYALGSTTAQTTADIAKKPITAFTAAAADKTYDGNAAASFTVTSIEGVLPADAGQVQLAAAAVFDDGPDAGENKAVTVTAAGLTGAKAGNYELETDPMTAAAAATIAPMHITFTVGAASFKYDGEPKSVSVTAEDENGRRFTAFTVTYSGSETAPSDAGTYTVHAALTDTVNYDSDWADKTLTIASAAQDQLTIVGLPGTVQYGDSFTLEAVGGSGDGTFTWSCAPSNTGVTLTPNGSVVTVAIGDGAVGQRITVTATHTAANYVVKTAAVVFVPVKKNVSFTLSDLTQTFDGQAKTAAVAPSDDSAAYAVTYDGKTAAPIAVGTYQVVVTATGNYAGTATGTLTVQRAALTGISVSQNGWTYGSPATAPTLSGTVPGGVTTTYSYNTADGNVPTDAGKYTVTATLTGANYETAVVSGTFTVARKELTAKAENAEREYGQPNPAFTVTYTGFVPGEDAAVLLTQPAASCAATAASNVGGYTIAVSGGSAANYSFVYQTGTLTIKPATVTDFYITGSAGSVSVDDVFTLRAYNGSQRAPVAWASSEPAVASIDANGEVTALKEGTTTISAALNDANYNPATATFELHVSKRTVTLTPGRLVAIYSGTAQSITLTSDTAGFVPEIGANVTVAYTLTTDPGVTTPKQVGTYSVVYTIVSDRYKGSGSAVLTINKAAVTLRAADISKTYGEANPAYALVGLLGDDAADPEYNARVLAMFTLTSGADAAGTKAPAGSYPIAVALKDGRSLTEDPNYNFTISETKGVLTVNQAPLSVLVPDVQRPFGKTNPIPAVTYQGFVNGENEGVLGGRLSLAYADTVTAASPVGTYADVLTGSGLTSGNYEITYVYASGSGADLTVTTLPVTVTGSGRTTALSIRFSEPVPGAAFIVTDAGGSAVPFTPSAAKDNRSYSLTGSFESGKTYTVAVGADPETYALTGSPVAVTISSYEGGGGGGSVSGYSVNIAKTRNGTVTPDRADAYKGDTVKLTVTPDSGYTLDTLTVADKNGNAVEVKQQAGVYTFTMPAGDVTVTATFKKTPAALFPFTDVPETHWARSAVEFAYANGLFAGVSDTAFSPDTAMTRGMLVTVLWRMEGKPVVNYAMSFKDVEGGEWYGEAVRWAASSGIVTGLSAETFAPNTEITREQLAAVLFRYAKFKGYDVSVGEDTNILSYTDAESISEYAIPAMQWACGAGLINGDAGKLMPRDDATRAQVAAILMRFIQNAVK